MSMLAKFSHVEDVYLFLSDFEEMCSMVWFLKMSLVVVRLCFILFTWKDLVQKVDGKPSQKFYLFLGCVCSGMF